MADNDDLGVMQAQLGLGARGSMSPLGIPTPMPQVRHPSEAARDAVQLTQSSAMQTMQTGSMINAAAAGGMGFGHGLGGFAAQYQANMASIHANQLSPWGAGMASSMMGMGGYVPGMMPSPIQMTPPNMGIYRPMAPPPMMTVPPIPPTPFFPGPFTPQLPPPMFTTNFERNQQLADYRGQQATALALSVPGVAARAGVDIAGSRMGAGLGALAGARLGGVPGAAIGGAIGAIGGFLGAENFLGQGVQNLVDDMNPIARMSRQAAQVRGISRGFVVGGSEVDVTGTGLNRTASVRLARQLHNLAGESGFQRETGGMFSTQDLMKITQLSGEQGLLNMAQNSGQITDQVRNISKALKAYMKLASEPDVTEAIRQLGQMRGMGLSLGESMLAVERAKSYGRMAGTSVQGIMQAGGLPGAMVFQQQGLSAGLGMQVGMGALGMARQAVAGGTFTPAQLSMLGGVHGVAQNNMEMAAAMLKQPLMAAAMSNYNPASGGFQLNPNAVGGLARGQFGIQGMANMGVSNMMRAVNQGGLGGLAAFSMDQQEMQDQLGRALGPEGIKMMGMQQILNTRRFLGVRGRGGLFAAAKAMGLSDDQARQSVQEMGSPEFFENMQRQIRATQQQNRAEALEAREATAATFLDRGAQKFAAVREGRAALSGLGIGYDDMVEGASAFFTNYGQDRAAAKSGQFVRRTPKSLLASSPLETRMLRNVDYRAILAGGGSAPGDRDTAIFRTPGGRAIGHSEALADFRDVLGGNSAADRQAYYSSIGGLEGAIGSFLGFGFASGEYIRGAQPNIQAGATGTARGMFATTDEQREARKRLSANLGSAKAMQFQQAFTKIAAKRAIDRSSMGGKNAAFVGSDYEDMVREAAEQVGVSPDKVSVADAQILGLQGASRQAGARGQGTFRGVEGAGEERRKAELDKILAEQESQGVDIFGDKGMGAGAGAALGAKTGAVYGFMTGGIAGAAGGALVGAAAGGIMGAMFEEGDRTKREAGMELLFAGDEDQRVRTLAALEAAATQEGPDSTAATQRDNYQEELQRTDPEHYDEIVRRAAELVERGEGGKGKGMLARAGMRLTSLNLDEMQQYMAEGSEAYEGRKAGLIYEKGLETYADKDVIASMSGNREEKLRSLLNSGKVKGKMVDIAKEYQAAKGNAAKQQTALRKAAELASSAGYATESELAGGEVAASDRKAQVASETAAGVASEARDQFPDAVKSFVEASRALEKAANQLGNATALTPAVNNYGSVTNYSIF